MAMRSFDLSDHPFGLLPAHEDLGRLLTPDQERALLQELAACKAKLSEALASIPEAQSLRDQADDDPALPAALLDPRRGDPRWEARLGAVYQDYKRLRCRLALANIRLVAHVAKRFQNRGIPLSDLMQEGICGLLEAIDRFDLAYATKLSTYATWWIRQAMQRAVASGAYPVKLSPRHLRQLAQNQSKLHQDEPQSSTDPSAPSSETLQRILAATRPTASLDASIDPSHDFTLLQIVTAPECDPSDQVDVNELIAQLLQTLRPRERDVLALRFGLGGAPRLSLSQVGKKLHVSKERVRQIQDRALEKLRTFAFQHNLGGTLSTA
ncbi:sigma-70 family RNA polymerase sigma factor [Tautonia sociabilis]|uniref:Sigma-70 family RNA polymerase sigma factor n=1 Tax=Tautonia sociabilis TaxID=2080755 RepID=A0A432MHL0_9BACT|nr:sigma-70 family RNA polymerase sigma factor [Tautonia sociabilis]RUL86326.1 sigma-70 family RNA polymerase sigma factor [Tautonia sociabilis]